MLQSMRNKHIACELEAKFIQDRITSVERNVAELCQVFGVYARKAARLRDKGDELAKVCITYSESEEINKSLSECLSSFATTLSTISDYGNSRVQTIDSKVVHELTQYEIICKHTKNEVKQIFAARERELARRRQLDRIKERNPSRQQILQAETELVKATAEVSRSVHNIEEHVIAFERQKLHDIKFIFLDFISTEMGYHAKALELLTLAYQDIQGIDEESDLQEFKKSLRTPEKHVENRKSMFSASQSLGSITSIFSASTRKRSPGIPRAVVHKSKNVSQNEKTAKPRFDDAEISGTDESDDDDESLEISKSDENVSPFIAKRYLK